MSRLQCPWRGRRMRRIQTIGVDGIYRIDESQPEELLPDPIRKIDAEQRIRCDLCGESGTPIARRLRAVPILRSQTPLRSDTAVRFGRLPDVVLRLYAPVSTSVISVL